jgi:dynein assembly factor 1
MNTKDDTNSIRDSEDENGANAGGPRCTKKWILDLFKKEWKLYYRTFELNEKLYFHYKGFERIENMHLFPELKCLYFEGNGIKKMEGLETNVQLVSLYLQENLIARIENIDTLSNLHTLQLSDNCISSIENLSFNVKLDSLYLKSNRIGRNGVSDLIGLLECPSIACLDI